MARPDLSQMTLKEKDALIPAASQTLRCATPTTTSTCRTIRATKVVGCDETGARLQNPFFACCMRDSRSAWKGRPAS